MDIFCARPSVLLVQTSWKHKRTWCFLFRMFQTRVAKNIFAQPCPLVNLAHLSAGLAPASWSMTHQNPAHVGLIPGVNICPKLGCVLLNGADFPSKWNRAHILITEPKLGTMCRTEPAQAWSSRVPTPCICSWYHVDILSFFSFLLLQYLSLKTLPRLESLSGAPVIYHDTTFYLWRTFPNQAYKVVHNL